MECLTLVIAVTVCGRDFYRGVYDAMLHRQLLVWPLLVVLVHWETTVHVAGWLMD